MKQESRLRIQQVSTLILALFLSVAVLVILLLTIATSGLRGINIATTFFYNADALYLPALFQDVISGQAWGWELTPAPYFWPDMALFFALGLLARNIHLTISLYAIAMPLLYIGAVGFLTYHTATRNRMGAASFLMLMALGSILLLSVNKGRLLSHVLTSGHHFGVLVGGLFSAGMVMSALKEERARWPVLGLLFIHSALLTLSDALYIPQFAVPLLFIVLFALWQKMASVRTAGALVISLASGTGFGFALYHLIPGLVPLKDTTSNTRLVDAATVFDRLGLLGSAFVNTFQSHPFETIIHLGFWLLAVSFSAFALFRLIRRRNLTPASDDPAERDRFVLMLILLALISLATLGAVLLAGVWISLVGFVVPAHYLLPLLILPFGPGWGWLLLAATAERAQRTTLRAASLLMGLLGLASVYSGLSELGGLPVRELANFTIDDVACVEASLTERELGAGLADYWQAKPIRVLTNNQIRTVQVIPFAGTMKPVLWIANRRWMEEPPRFLIRDMSDTTGYYSFDVEAISAAVGPPNEIISCGDYEILTYPDENERLAFLASLENPHFLLEFYDTGTFPAFMLPSQVGTVRDRSRVAMPGDEPGFLTYGPYLWRNPGETISFTVDYELAGCEPGTEPGWWDMVVTPIRDGAVVPEDAILPYTETLPAEDGGNALSGRVTLEEPSLIDIRVFHNGQCTLTVNSYQIDIDRN